MAEARLEPQTSDPTSVASPGNGRAALVVVSATCAATVLLTGNTSVYGLTDLPLFYDVSLPRLIVAVIGVLAALALLALGAGGGRAVRVHPAVGLLAVVAVLAGVSAVFAVDPRLAVLGLVDRLEGVVTWLLYPLVALAALNAVGKLRDLRVLATAVAGAATLCALYGILQWAGIEWANLSIENPGFDVRRAFATFGNPNFLGGLLVLALPVAVGLALSAEDERRAGGWWAAAVAVGLALFATFTRGAWLGGAAGVAALVFAVRGRTRLRRLDRVALAACGVAAAVALVAGIVASGEISLAERLTFAPSGAGSVSERALAWQAAADAALERPLAGYGPDNFISAFRLHRPDAVAEQFDPAYLNSNAHDWPLQVAATLGIPAALAFSAALVWALVAAWGAGRRAAGGDVLVGAVAAGCIGFAVHMLFNVAVLGATVPFFALLGGALAPASRSVRLPGAAGRGLAVAFAALAVAAVVVAVPVVSADHDYLASRLAFRGMAEGDAATLALSATLGDPTRVRYMRGGAEAMSSRYYGAASAGADDARIRFDGADKAFLAHLKRYPSDYPALAWHAALLADGAERFDDPELAERARQVAERASDLDAQAYQVAPLAEGRTDAAARRRALSVPGVP